MLKFNLMRTILHFNYISPSLDLKALNLCQPKQKLLLKIIIFITIVIAQRLASINVLMKISRGSW